MRWGNLGDRSHGAAVGATANLAGSGGAIVGTYEDEGIFVELSGGRQADGVAVIKPKIVSSSPLLSDEQAAIIRRRGAREHGGSAEGTQEKRLATLS